MTEQQLQDLILIVLFLVFAFALWLIFRRPDLLMWIVTFKG